MFLPSDPRVSALASLALPPWALFFRAFGALLPECETGALESRGLDIKEMVRHAILRIGPPPEISRIF
jgi:hypothetical protein